MSTMNAEQLERWAAELAERQEELTRREAAMREWELRQQQHQHQSGARRHRRSVGAAHDDGLRSAQESSSDGEVDEHDFEDVHRVNNGVVNNGKEVDDNDDDDDDDDDDAGAHTTVKLSELKKKHGKSYNKRKRKKNRKKKKKTKPFSAPL
jgi:hypothetical protein